jgi:glycosyltransferase involved in cell wall biosynthesis
MNLAKGPGPHYRRAGALLVRGDFVGILRTLRNVLGRSARRMSIRLTSPAPSTVVRVYGGFDHLPTSHDVVTGAVLGLVRLHGHFPIAPRDFNLLYLGSATLPPDAVALMRIAHRRRTPLVWNQNGVRAAYDPRTEQGLRRAAHVFFQSAFCKLAANRMYGESDAPSEVLHNAVDTQFFLPASAPPRDLTILLAGTQYRQYRFESAVRAFALVAAERSDARLLVTGSLSWAADPLESAKEGRRLVGELGLEQRIQFVGGYTQQQAPQVFGSASLLLHTVYNDCCPSVVLEAMSCGLPVVYSASGGVPELVGAEAGIGIPAPRDFERHHPPDPKELAAAILQLADALEIHGQAARARVVELFDIRQWAQRLREVFEELLANGTY